MNYSVLRLAALACMLVFSGCKAENGPEAKIIDECGETGRLAAWTNAKKFVQQQLKAPATAEFPPFDDPATAVRVVERNQCQFAIWSYVDAQNTYGAKLRNKIVVLVEYHPLQRRWTADSDDVHLYPWVQ